MLKNKYKNNNEVINAVAESNHKNLNPNLEKLKHPLYDTIITVDGPAGAGKGTLCKAVAKIFHAKYIDTGSLYRSIAYLAIRDGSDMESQAGIDEVFANLKYDFKHIGNNIFRTYIDGQDVEGALRTSSMGVAASTISKNPKIREAVSQFTQKYVQDNKGKYGVIVDGQDGGTVQFKDAKIKIFLDASQEVRANRRYLDLLEQGLITPFDEVLTGITTRDEQDKNRKIAPLKPAIDAYVLDSSALNAQEVLEKSLRIIITKIRQN